MIFLDCRYQTTSLLFREVPCIVSDFARELYRCVINEKDRIEASSQSRLILTITGNFLKRQRSSRIQEVLRSGRVIIYANLLKGRVVRWLGKLSIL